MSCWLPALFCAFFAPACLGETEDEGDGGVEGDFLEGTIGAQYDLSFEAVRAEQIPAADHLVIRYARGEGINEESPVMMRLRPTPSGPGRLTYHAGDVLFANSISGGETLPDLIEATVQLEAFTPDTAGSPVVGAFTATFSDGGTGELTLNGGFVSPILEVIR